MQNFDLYYIRLVNNQEIVGVLLEDESDRLLLQSPLELERGTSQQGDYIGFATPVPLQLEESLEIKKDKIAYFTSVKSETLRRMYTLNLPSIMESFSLSEERSQESTSVLPITFH